MRPALAVSISPLSGTLAYAAVASVGTGVALHGVYFMTRAEFGMGDLPNLLLGLVIQLPYIPAALAAGPLAQRFGARRVMFCCIAGMSLMCLALATMPPLWAWWLLVPLYNAFAGVQWPVVEAYVAAGRHGPDMRRAIGLFNITWAGTIGPGLWLVSVLHGQSALTWLILALLHLSSAAVVMGWAARPAEHDAEMSRRHTTDEYPHLLRSARVLLPVSYILLNMLSPLLPGIWDRLAVDAATAPALSSAWMIARVAIFVVMFIWIGWHGRWGILLGGGALLIGGMVVVLALPLVVQTFQTGFIVQTESPYHQSGWLLYQAVGVLALIGLGAGQGMIYYAALYYGMAVGRAEIASGGKHEASIGVGYVLGPLLGYAGGLLPLGPPGALGGILLVAGAVGLVAAGVSSRFYFAALRRRRGAE